MSNRAVLDAYNSLHQATHPKPTHHFTEGRHEDSVVGFGEAARKDPTPYHYRCARDPANDLHASRTPTGRPAAWARWLWEPSGTGPSARRPQPAPSLRLAVARALCRPPAATAGLARVAVRAGGVALGAQLWEPHESRLQGPSPPGDSTQESRGGCSASQGPSPSGLAPAPPARACQGARGLPLPTASTAARRGGRKAGRTDPETPSRFSGPWLPSGAPTPPSSSLALLPPPP